MTKSELTALAIDRQDRCIENVYGLVGAIHGNGADLSAGSLHARCLAAMARVMHPIFAFQAEIMAKQACMRSRELGELHPFEPLPAYFQDEESLRKEFCAGQRCAWGTYTPPGTPSEPLLVKTIALRGEVAHDDYDEHPGLAYYRTREDWDAVDLARERGCQASLLEDDARSERLKRLAAELEAGLVAGLALAQAMERAEVLQAEVEAVESTRQHISDGTFSTHGVMLLDQHGKLIQKRTSQGWLQPAPQSQWAALLKKASDKDREASEESRWDNFETAKRLRAEASDIRELVMLSQRLPFAAVKSMPKAAT
ncbi:hypothetical protein [Azohydromonas lata]|uniref:Uncharacterized protein n=1 Tax=Azohydromonas lata TaxID=45677 RepID=A0ABU5I7N8_9BURK|nr:hypothetical protein [Azohydromonas lata]MDZ5454988.1 hypothetical protein [Azohydromonas lata]